jgi:uncharacterized protein
MRRIHLVPYVFKLGFTHVFAGFGRLAKLMAAAVLLSGSAATQAALDANPSTRLSADLRCLLGVYALPGKRFITITGNSGQPRELHYTLASGRFGSLQETSTGTFTSPELSLRFEPCAAGQALLVQGDSKEAATRLALAESTTFFASDGNLLHGKLLLPPAGASAGSAQALVVWIEGSNNNPATDDAQWPYELARRGVAVFVYDKRGTGASGGTPTANFEARARDSAAALQAARQLAPYIKRVGVMGASQGGWVAPLVAQLTPLDFVVTAFALADGPVAQDQALVAQDLQDAQLSPPERQAAQQAAQRLTTITEKLVRSNQLDVLTELDAFKAQHLGAAWLQAIQARSYTGLFLKFSSEQIRAAGPAMAQGLNFNHDPLPVIASIQPRQLWLLGGSDRQAPNTHTQNILRQLQTQGRPISVLVFPQADHGLVETQATPNGTVKRYAPHSFELAAQWILHRQSPAAGAGAGAFVVQPLSP